MRATAVAMFVLAAGCTSKLLPSLEPEVPPPVDSAGAFSTSEPRVAASIGHSATMFENDPGVSLFSRVAVLDDRPVPEMRFRHYGVNPTIETTEERFSTFSVDVDTASHAVVRAYLDRGQLPPAEAVRVEELVNAYDYGYAADPDAAFTLHAEALPSPTRPGYHLLHLGLQAREVERADRKAAHLVFVIDVSGSMDRENRLGLVKRSLRMLVDELGPEDRVGIVVYGTRGRVVLESTPASRRGRILDAIDALRPEGSTNVQQGLDLGYAMAAEHLSVKRVNRVILCSDGMANAGITTDPDGIFGTIRREAARGITISTVGFGMGHYNDVMMERLAQLGDGNYSYVDSLDEARRIFQEELVGTLQVLARDAKVQVEFDPGQVARYRLLGYENRMLEREDFTDDRKDAGEVGAGDAVTALYEVQFHDAGALAPGAFGHLRVRYRDPDGGASRSIERALPATIVKRRFADGSTPTRLSAVVAAFAEKLRGSYWARTVRYEALLQQLEGMGTAGRQREQVAELRRLVDVARRIDDRPDRFAEHGPVERMGFDHVPVLR